MIVTKLEEEAKKSGLSYPLLMKSKNDGMIILASQNNSFGLFGVVISSYGAWKVGQCCNVFASDVFEPYIGKITLQNDVN